LQQHGLKTIKQAALILLTIFAIGIALMADGTAENA
jgi:hypothetical protein